MLSTSNRDFPPSRQTAVPPRHGIHCLLAQRLVEIKFSKELFVEPPTTIETYLKSFANELGDRILDSFPPLQGAQDPTSPLLAKLLRRPYPAQAVAVGGIVKRLAEARSAAVVAECGTGNTLISLASLYVASGERYTF